LIAACGWGVMPRDSTASPLASAPPLSRRSSAPIQTLSHATSPIRKPCNYMDLDALSVILWPCAGPSLSPHFNLITSLAYDSSSSSLFTAARDARVIQWQQRPPGSPPAHWFPAAAATPHTDWINDIHFVGEGRVLSCSSDGNVTITNVGTGTVLRQFRHHEDHVTCLSPMNSSGKFVSAGAVSNPCETVTFCAGQRRSRRPVLSVGRGGVGRRRA
jgi:WD40 repeat protein